MMRAPWFFVQSLAIEGALDADDSHPDAIREKGWFQW